MCGCLAFNIICSISFQSISQFPDSLEEHNFDAFHYCTANLAKSEVRFEIEGVSVGGKHSQVFHSSHVHEYNCQNFS